MIEPKGPNQDIFERWEAVTRQLQELEIKETKHKNGTPTVIIYKGKRYVLDHKTNYRK